MRLPWVRADPLLTIDSAYGIIQLYKFICKAVQSVLFNSLEFLIFFPIVTLIYFLIPGKAKQLWLLISSYYFYMCWNAKYALLILFSTAVTYLSGLLLQRAGERAGQYGEAKTVKLKSAIEVPLNACINPILS